MKQYRLIAEIVLIIAIVILAYFLNRYNNNINRLEHNAKIEHQSPDKQKNEYLTKNEFKEIYANKLDTLEKYIKNLKVGKIQNITTIHNYYIDSSKTIYTAKEINDSIYDISYSDKCFGFNGLFNLYNKRITLLNKNFTNTFDIVDYYQNKRLFGIKFLPRWSLKKVYYRKVVSSCKNDSVTIKKINLIKIKDLNSIELN